MYLYSFEPADIRIYMHKYGLLWYAYVDILNVCMYVCMYVAS